MASWRADLYKLDQNRGVAAIRWWGAGQRGRASFTDLAWLDRKGGYDSRTCGKGAGSHADPNPPNGRQWRAGRMIGGADIPVCPGQARMPAPPVLGWQLYCHPRCGSTTAAPTNLNEAADRGARCHEDDVRLQEEGKSDIGRRSRCDFLECFWEGVSGYGSQN